MSIWKWIWQRSRNASGSENRSSHHKQNQMPADQLLLRHEEEAITGSVEQTIAFIRNVLGPSDDFMMRRFTVFSGHPAVLLYISNIVDQTAINEDILKPLMYRPAHLEGAPLEDGRIKDILMNQTFYHCEIYLEGQLVKIIDAILQGKSVVVVDGLDEAFLIGSRQVEKRAVEQPETEQVIQGPREGFVEPLGTNLGLLRYRLPTSDFRVHTMKIGRITKSVVAVCYIEGVANPELVKEVKKRLEAIDIDAVLDVGYLEQFIEDNHFSPFPQIQNTERPDKAVANMVEGRVAILMDGSPFALIAPVVFSQFYQSVEDYSSRFLQGSFVRAARVVALVFSLIFSSLYVAVISYNPELIPTKFAVAVAGGRAGVPFPAVMEILIMEISMEVLREATIRLPQQVGGALSIVGVLVIGQAAVSAGFASPITVVVIALTTIGSFATPAYNAAFALRMLRFPLIVLSGIFGTYGLVVGLILVTNHLLSLRSFGVPYMTPAVPENFEGMKDLVIRGPLWWMKKRPAFVHTANPIRVGSESDQIKKSPGNTLNPVQEEKQWGGDSDENSSGNNGNSGGGNNN